MNPKTTGQASQTATGFAGPDWHRTATATGSAAGAVSWSFASRTAATPSPGTSSAASMIVVPGPMIVVQRYEYTGRELASESNEYYFRYRVYGPALGQFFARDPLGYVDGMGLYAGVFAESIGMDPLGRTGLPFKWKQHATKVVDKEDEVSKLDIGGEVKVLKLPRNEETGTLEPCACRKCPIGAQGNTPIYRIEMRCDFPMEVRIDIQFPRKQEPAWINFVAHARMEPERALYHKEIMDAQKREDALAIYDFVVKHEEAHVDYFKGWYASRHPKVDSYHNKAYPTMADCDAAKETFNKEFDWDYFYFGLFQFDKIHKEKTATAGIPPYPMKK